MAIDFSNLIIKTPISSGTSNWSSLNSTEVKDGIIKDSDFRSMPLNSLFLKVSNSLEQIQKNNHIQYILNNEYYINSTVLVIYKEANTERLIPAILKCVNTNLENTCNVLPNDNYEIDEDNNIIFTDNNWNSVYWTEISKNNIIKKSISVEESSFNYSLNKLSKDNSQAQHIKLFDFSNIVDDTLYDINFDLIINRYTNIFMNCNVLCDSNLIKLNINTINNINGCYLQNGRIWYENSIFADIALEGMIFSVDEVNKILYLTILSAEIPNKDSFDVSININKGSYNVNMSIENNSNYIDNNDFVLVPFIRNASNIFDGNTLSILDYAYTLSYVEMFKMGLLNINGETTLDRWLYPIARKTKINSGYWNGTIYDMNERYKLQTSDNTRYIDSKFPNIVGETGAGAKPEAKIEGAFKITSNKKTSSGYNTETPYVNGGSTYRDVFAIYNTEIDTSNTDVYALTKPTFAYLYKDVDPDTGNYTDIKKQDTPITNDYFFNSDKENPDRLSTASIKTFPYIKVW